ncbi:XI-2, partial [Symbiodinium necroappetens]
PDNTSLVFLNDASILENLRVRHEVDDIYTYTASVLLAVNPYHDIEGLYGEEQCARYRGKHIGALPPHPYAIADTAYRALVRERRNQGFVISGESGAGKTETAKIVMEYLGFVSGSSNQTTAQIQRRVLQAQPILESFGNAVTMRNNNSSRFGKYNRIFFDESGTLVNASVTTYLLESSRVVSHAKRERTYHCFYEMLSGLSDEELSKLHLDRSEPYLLLTGEAEDLDWNAQFEERDQKHFDRLWFALAEVGFSEPDINAIFQ